jgi:hypothetical protein
MRVLHELSIFDHITARDCVTSKELMEFAKADQRLLGTPESALNTS